MAAFLRDKRSSGPRSPSSAAMSKREIHEAAEGGDLALLRRLVNPDSLDAPDRNKWTPLMWAVRHRRVQCVAFLIAQNASVTRCSDKHETALHIAVQDSLAGRKQVTIAALLLANNADVNKQTIWGWSPLMWAACSGFDECVTLLLERKADATIRAHDGWAVGKTARDIAAERDRLSCVQLLEEHEDRLRAAAARAEVERKRQAEELRSAAEQKAANDVAAAGAANAEAAPAAQSSAAAVAGSGGDASAENAPAACANGDRTT